MAVKYVGILGEIQEAYEIAWHQEFKGNGKNLDVVDLITSDYNPHYFPDFKYVENYSDEIGETAYAVFTWKGEYYKLPYSYRSHEGSSYWGNGSNLRKVTPKQVLKTIYE